MKKLLFPLFCALNLSVSHAATINWSAEADVGFINASGDALAQGNLLRLGYFTISDSAVQAAANDLTLLSASWHSIAETTVGAGYGSDGIFAATSIPTLVAGEFNHQIYLWALNSANVLTATQQAIFYEPSTSNASWNLPATNAAFTTLDIAQAKPASGGVYLVGSYQPSAPSIDAILGPGSHAVQLASITAAPEPSRMLLILAGAGVVMFRRRRRC